MRYAYPCVLTPEEDAGFSVSFPDVPEALTCGDDRADALTLAEDALAAALGTYVKLRENIPLPSQATGGQALVAVPPVTAAKLALYTEMRRQKLTRTDLAERLELSERAVRKLLNPEHHSRMSQIEKALRAVGRGLVVGGRAA